MKALTKSCKKWFSKTGGISITYNVYRPCSFHTSIVGKNPSDFCLELFLTNVKADMLLFLFIWLKKTISQILSGFLWMHLKQWPCYLLVFLTGMCVLAGCDFLPSIPGIGIRKAYALVSKYRNLDRVRILYL